MDKDLVNELKNELNVQKNIISELEKQIADIESKINKYQFLIESSKIPDNVFTEDFSEEPKPKIKRTPSEYNKFMKEELFKLKKNNPELSHKECFKIVCEMWKNSTKNPKNS